MPYASPADLEARYGVDELEQRESMLPAGALAQALADADAVIDGYCAGRYAVPLAPAPDNLTRVACQLARYGLLGNAADERARADYEDAMAWLKDVAAGRVLLVAAAPASVTAVAARPVTRSAPRQFAAPTLDAYR